MVSTRNFVFDRKVLDTGFFHPIPVSDGRVPVNLGKHEITFARLVTTTCTKGDLDGFIRRQD